MGNILLCYSSLNLIFLFNTSIGNRETYSSSFACDIVLRVASSLVVPFGTAFLSFIHGLIRLSYLYKFYFFLCVGRSYISFILV